MAQQRPTLRCCAHNTAREGTAMTPQTLLQLLDSGQPWPWAKGQVGHDDLAEAYRLNLAVRALRLARGELPRGYKIGFTNRTIWQRYQVFAPIWGTVYDSTLRYCDGHGALNLAACCLPRIEPECVFGLRATPAPNATLDDLYHAIAWVAPGFEIVQSHLDWKMTAADGAADGGLHARLLVGRPLPLAELAPSAQVLDVLLAASSVTLCKGDAVVDEGRGANVLDSPLRALQYFLAELRQCPGAAELLPGDVVTTGTWTDAYPVAPGEHWTAYFSAPLGRLKVDFS
jgi:2-oxo-3-hexenedioate decarboxylase